MTDNVIPIRPPLQAAAAQRLASDPSATVWVSASAGTGKTRVLTDRVLRLLLRGTDPQRILCITFTRAAAAEMATRVVDQNLARWTSMGEADLDARLDALGEHPTPDLRARARRLFARVLETPGGLRIQTIHAFCQSVLRRFPLEAGISPHFQPLDDFTATDLLRIVRDEVIADPAHGDAVGTLATLIQDEDFDALVAALVGERGRLGRLLRRHPTAEDVDASLSALLEIGADATPDSVLAAAADDAALDLDGLRRSVAAMATGSKTDKARGQIIADWLAAEPAERVELFPTYQSQFLTQKGEPKKTLATKDAIKADPDLAEFLFAEAARLVAVVERQRAATVRQGTSALMALGRAILDRYATVKRQRGAMDFEDMILATAHLLGQAHMTAWVLYKLDGGLDHILVDEAQDTNPDQWRIVTALADEFMAGHGARDQNRTLFVVGDEKQSIYSFQRADPTAYVDVRQRYADRAEAGGPPVRVVALNTSFRSTPAVLDTVDAVFADPAVANGVVGDPSDAIRHRPHRRQDGGTIELWPLIAPPPRTEPEPWEEPPASIPGDAPAMRMAAVVAGRIADWLASGTLLASQGRPIRAGDVMILVRTRGAFAAQVIRALKERKVPVAGVDRLRLASSIAVQDLLATAQFALLPEDDLTLAALLKSPLIELTEDQLLDLAAPRDGTLWAALASQRQDATLGETVAYLDRIRRLADRLAPHDFLMDLLVSPCPGDPVSGRRALLHRLGPDAADPIEELVSAALAFERRSAPSMQQFVSWIAADDVDVKREQSEQDRDEVRVLTVHGAKGLQAPIVILPDTTAASPDRDRLLWGEADEDLPLWAARRDLEDPVMRWRRSVAATKRDQEYRRLLYVALTRAEDSLYIGGFHGTKGPAAGCWYELCVAGMKRLETAAPAVCDHAGDIIRYVVPQRRQPAPPHINTPVPPTALPAWIHLPPPDEPEPPKPLTPSRPPEPAPSEVRATTAIRRGILAHRLLQSLPDLPAQERRDRAVSYLVRAGMTGGDAKALAGDVLAVLELPDLATVFGPGSRAEVPVIGMVDGLRLAGQVDRLAVEADCVTIIDYKTRRAPPNRPEQAPTGDLAQMAAYRAALQRIYPAHRIRCVLVWTDGPQAMALPDELLDTALRERWG